MADRQIIVVSGRESATNADILQATRLQTVPRNGILTFQMLADVSTAAANMVASIELPDGGTPLSDVIVPGANPSLEGVLDERQMLQVSFPVQQGGHATFSVIETGGVVMAFRVIYTPAELARFMR